jgi:hypothetical protein
MCCVHIGPQVRSLKAENVSARCHNSLIELPINFCGRDAIVAQLVDHLSGQTRVVVLQVTRGPGCGVWNVGCRGRREGGQTGV